LISAEPSKTLPACLLNVIIVIVNVDILVT
jgi:hypothetical protein